MDDTFILTQIPNVYDCKCSECEGIIEHELRKLQQLENRYIFIFKYKNIEFKIDKDGYFSKKITFN
jgi:hypothetical protein